MVVKRVCVVFYRISKMFWTAVIYGTIVLLGYYLIKKQLEFNKLARIINKIPGDRRIPIFGTSYRFFGVKAEGKFNDTLIF